MLKKSFFVLFAVLSLFSCSKKSAAAAKEAEKNDRLLFAVIAMTFKNDYWQKVNYGCNLASFEQDVDYYFDGMQEHTAGAYVDQIALIQRAIDMKVDGIMLSAIDKEKLAPIVDTAVAAGIPLITFDSGVTSGSPLSFIATDNLNAGRIAAQEMQKLIAGGSVAVIANDLSSQTTTERAAGFAEVMAESPDYNALEPVVCEGNVATAAQKFNELYEAHPDLKAVFCTNSESAIGTAQAVKKAGQAGKIAIIGFDSPPEEIAFLEQNVIQGLIVQNPFLMGYNGVVSLANYLRKGVAPPKTIDTGVVFVTTDNLNEPEIIEAIYPLKK